MHPLLWFLLGCLVGNLTMLSILAVCQSGEKIDYENCPNKVE